MRAYQTRSLAPCLRLCLGSGGCAVLPRNRPSAIDAFSHGLSMDSFHTHFSSCICLTAILRALNKIHSAENCPSARRHAVPTEVDNPALYIFGLEGKQDAHQRHSYSSVPLQPRGISGARRVPQETA